MTLTPLSAAFIIAFAALIVLLVGIVWSFATDEPRYVKPCVITIGIIVFMFLVYVSR